MNPEEAESFARKCAIGMAICVAIILISFATLEVPGDNPVCILAAVMIVILLMAGAMAGEFGNNSHSTTTKKSRQKKKRKCGLCRKEGHTRRTCPDKKKQEKEVKQPTAKEEYWSFTCVGVEEEKCGEKIFIEKWVRDVIVNYQKARDSDKRLMDDDEAVREAAYNDLDRTFELKNEKGETMDIGCPKCSMTIPYQWDLDPGGKPEDWVRDTPPYRLMRIEMYSNYELGKWKRKKTRAESKAEAEKKVLADFSKSMDRVLGKKSSKSLDDLVDDFIAKDMGNVGIPGQVVKECLDCKRIRAENDWSPCPCGGMSFRRKTM